MNRFLLLALTAGMISPIAANAESVWLILKTSTGLEKVQSLDMAQCEREGQKWVKKKFSGNKKTYQCIIGK
ncbi:MAG: hypothetical protein CBC24_05030 [Candidatus Pelagibacter sp. TMED64]|nr:hypothetical protein [Candidatus Pelagibacter sp.]OUU65684.1 MAG: hypothetical protein CBC24_05030 [Candidatus Pelagibacter sp. TMED64]